MSASLKIFWDIDGTLLSTGGRGFPYFFSAIKDIFDLQGSHQDFSIMHGLTDFEAIGQILQMPVHQIPKQKLQTCIELYEQRVSDVFKIDPPKVLREILNSLNAINSNSSWTQTIGTGNSFGGAKVKLSTAGLLRFFDANQIFCSSLTALTRIEVIENCKESLRPGEMGVIIGDTPSDVKCAKEVGMKCIAVPSGAYDSDTLRLCGAEVTLSLGWKAQDLMESIKTLTQGA